MLLQAAKEALSGEADSPGPSLSSSLSSLTQIPTPSSPSIQTPTRPGSAFHRGSGRATPARSASRSNVNSGRLSNTDGPLSLMGKLDALSMAQAHRTSQGLVNGERPVEDVEPPQGFNATVDRIIFDHLEALSGAVKDEQLRQLVSDDIVDDCERLRDFLMAAKVSCREVSIERGLSLSSLSLGVPTFSLLILIESLPRFITTCLTESNDFVSISLQLSQIIEEISPRSQDIIIGVGERLSCRIVVGALLDAGINAELVTLESIVDADFLQSIGLQGAGEDAQLNQAFYDKLAERLGERLNQCKGTPVVTGE